MTVTALEALFSLATSGGDVRARVGGESQPNPLLEIGESPAGVDLVVEWFREQASLDKQVLLFLVGGPGGGKSHAAAKIVAGYSEAVPRHPGLAHRKHLFKVSAESREIAVINDATMRGADHADFPLLRDIKLALENKQSLVCCVNRGILVEEANCVESELRQALEVLNGLEKQDPNGRTPLISEDWFVLAGSKVQIVTLNFDLCSLFEKAPVCSIGSDGKFGVGAYKIAPFTSRFGAEIDCPAAKLILATANKIWPDIEHLSSLNPVHANVRALRSSSVVQAICSVVRASEVISGRRFTYRELWGLTARLILGELPSKNLGGDLNEAVDRLTGDSQLAGFSFTDMLALAQLRLPMSLFGAGFFHGANSRQAAGNDPVSGITSQADPIRDMRPGVFLGKPADGWSDVVHEAFSGATSAGSPLLALKSSLEANHPLFSLLSDFDELLDLAFIEAMSANDEKSRQNMAMNYSSYLSRAYALSEGISAFLDVTSIWASLWTMTPNLPDYEKEQLLTLLRPKRNLGQNPVGSSLIPLYESRTRPISGNLVSPVLALRVTDIDLETQTDGDSIFLLIKEHGKVIAKVLLDFPLLREALACIPGYQGLTERSYLTAPRLERIRSSNLVPGAQRRNGQFRVAMTDSDFGITVETSAN